MVKTCKNSVIEIWSTNYINNIKYRHSEDKNIDIIQIERGSSTSNDYIVEFIRHDLKETTKKEG